MWRVGVCLHGDEVPKLSSVVRGNDAVRVKIYRGYRNNQDEKQNKLYCFKLNALCVAVKTIAVSMAKKSIQNDTGFLWENLYHFE